MTAAGFLLGPSFWGTSNKSSKDYGIARPLHDTRFSHAQSSGLPLQKHDTGKEQKGSPVTSPHKDMPKACALAMKPSL